MKSKILIVCITFILSSFSAKADYVNVCDRGFIAHYLVSVTKSKSCAEINPLDLAKMEEVHVSADFFPPDIEVPDDGLAYSILKANAFHGMKFLKKIEVSGAAVVEAQVFQNLPLLSKLRLSIETQKQLMDSFPEGLFSNLTRLESLVLESSFDPPEMVGTPFHDLKNLDSLTLTVRAEELNSNLLTGLELLTQLDISLYMDFYREKKPLPEGLFTKTPLLKSLTWRDQRKRELPKAFFIGAGNLQTLVFKEFNVPLEAEGVFEPLKSLRVLRFEQIQRYLETYAQNGLFVPLENLEVLESRNCPIISDLKSLKVLTVEDMSFDTPRDYFKHANKLEKLVIKDIFKKKDLPDFSPLENLQELSLAEGQDGKRLTGVFHTLKKLKKLHYEGEDLDVELLKGLSELQHFSVRITLGIWDHDPATVPRGIFDGLENLRKIDIALDGGRTHFENGVFSVLTNLTSLNFLYGAPIHFSKDTSLSRSELGIREEVRVSGLELDP